MVKPCKLCGLDEEKFGAKHRCIKPPSEKRQPYTPKAPATAQTGRLAPRPADTQPAPSRQPQLSDILAAITNLTKQFEALRSALTDKLRTDA